MPTLYWCPHQVLAATLTLSQPGRADYAHPILVSTPSFESHRRSCFCIQPFLPFSLILILILPFQLTTTGPFILKPLF